MPNDNQTDNATADSPAAHGSPSSNLQSLLKRITPLPWLANATGDIHGSDGQLLGCVLDNPDDGTQPLGEETSDANEEYLTHAVNMFPRLLAAAKHLAGCDCQSSYIKVPCSQCDAAIAAIIEAEMENGEVTNRTVENLKP